MNERQARWNDKYARGEETYDLRPSPPLPEAVAALSPGLALDVACGAGRHALYLAEHGFRVVAVDYAQAGLDLLAAEARRRGIGDRIEPVLADIEAGEMPVTAGRFDVVCDFYFLSRPLFPVLRDALKPGGLFVAAIHVESAAAEAPHRFLLAPGELRALVEGWGFEVLHSREGNSNEGGHQHATSEIIARRNV